MTWVGMKLSVSGDASREAGQQRGSGRSRASCRHLSAFIPFQLSLFLAGLPSDRSTACGLAPLCEGVLGSLRLLFTERGPSIPLPWLPSVCHLPFWQLSEVKKSLSRVRLFCDPVLPTRLHCLWKFPDENIGVGCISFSRRSSQTKD